jgi:hypothetical protein
MFSVTEENQENTPLSPCHQSLPSCANVSHYFLPLAKMTVNLKTTIVTPAWYSLTVGLI